MVPINKKKNVEPSYNDIVLCNISSIASGILWYQLIKKTAEPGYNDVVLYNTSSNASGILWYQLIKKDSRTRL